MSDKLLNLSTVTVAVPEEGRMLRTTCPHCKQDHGIVLAHSPQEKDALTTALETLGGYNTATYGKRKGRPRKPVETRQSSVKGQRVSSNELATVERTVPYVAPHTLRPRFRYFAADRRKNPDAISPTRRRIYTLIAKSKGSGVIEADLLKRGIPHGTIQQTIHWLRENGWVKYEQETPLHAHAA